MSKIEKVKPKYPGVRSKSAPKKLGYRQFAMEIRKATGDGQELLEYLLQTFRGTGPFGAESAAQRWACELLLDRAFGKSVAVVDITNEDEGKAGEPILDLSAASYAQIEALNKAAEVLEELHETGKGRVIDVGPDDE